MLTIGLFWNDKQCLLYTISIQNQTGYLMVMYGHPIKITMNLMSS